jgi:D-3-phosphoglycerate dehydrogenase
VTRFTVLCTSAMHPDAVALLQTAATVRTAPDTTPDSLAAAVDDADVVIVRDPLPPAAVTGPRLRAAIRHGAGLDMIPVAEATAAGVLVANVPGANARSVAEHVVMAVLALSRRLRAVDADLRRAGWAAGRAHAGDSREIRGRTLGLVGTGSIGRAVRDIVGPGFGMEVLGFSPRPERIPADIAYRPLHALLAESDVVVLACPLTDDTRGLLDAPALARMKPEALLVNVARGAVVDDDALLAALQAGRLGGAALDVVTNQPLPPDHPYLALDRVLITPHIAGITEDSMRRMGMGAAEAALDVLAGRLPATLVNPDAIDRYRSRHAAAPMS